MAQFMKRANKALTLLLTDPPNFWRRIKPYVFKSKSGRIQINGINFNIDLELDSVMRSMYFGGYQFEITRLLNRFLKDGDTFIDVGANIGYISAFALGLVGKSGEVHSFEPVPQYLKRLQNIQKDNPAYRHHINGVALGEREGTATISVTNLNNIGWNTMVPGLMSKDTVKEEVDVTVTTLDHYLSQKNTQRLRFVKIDTEGYEFPVMKGFQQYLRAANEMPILVIEVAPTAYPGLKSSLSEFSDFMKDLGYIAMSIDLANQVEVEKLEETTDVVFLPRSLGRRDAAVDGNFDSLQCQR
jgi:FkbM family methyltransferase